MDAITAVPELMNESKKPISVYITMKYEILPQAEAASYKEVLMAWLDITGSCGTSEESASKGAYERKQRIPWRSNVEGKMLYATGHGHDGATHVTIYRRRGTQTEPICTSYQRYGGPGYVGLDKMPHISAVSYCNFTESNAIHKGDELFVGAAYNSSAHMMMDRANGRGLEPIMGIARVYIGT